jgi:hypothetical protein
MWRRLRGAATQSAASQGYQHEVVCKQAPVLGSRISKEVCKTAADRAAANAYVDRLQHGAMGQSKSAN